ncbi:hypothetical protein CTAYLR_001003 [Chrysophaeum taylorii]|uniref:Uncharacterized protein n=1 Tax=Chrysophaeum taylorii TaxID=2483200 RepID=A0AAD7XMR8_9STRA|nr:hypothetical protein CTAYLR_001003 [Chrysophaeum taylorii]
MEEVVVRNVSEHSEIAVKSRARRTAAFDLVTEHNVKRIQDFLDEPFRHIGDALEEVGQRLRARGVVLDYELSKTRKKQRALEALQEPTSASREAAASVRRSNSHLRALGPRSRFSDGDGTFWDRWLNTTGCIDGGGNYIASTVPVRGGNLVPRTGFKESPTTPVDKRPLARIEQGRRALAKLMEAEQKVEEPLKGAFRDAYATRDTLQKSRLALVQTRDYHQGAEAAPYVSQETIDAMLGMLEATTRVDAAGRRHVTLPSQGLATDDAIALGVCLDASVTKVPIHSVDLSGNSDVGTRGVAAVLRSLAKAPSLVALDLSHVSFDVSTVRVLSKCLGESLLFTALRHLCLKNTKLDDVLAVRIVRALRDVAAPALETLDVSSNAIGSVNHLVKQHDDEEKEAHYLAPLVGGPLGALLDPRSDLDETDVRLELRQPSSIPPAGTRGAASLRMLSASWNLLGPDATAGLAKTVASHANLVELHLAYNVFGDGGVAELSEALLEVPKLALLDVSANEIGPRGALSLAAAAHRAVALRKLIVAENPIGPVGAALLLAVCLVPANRREVVLASAKFARAAARELESLTDHENHEDDQESPSAPDQEEEEEEDKLAINADCAVVSLMGCETRAARDSKMAMDWLFNMPVLACTTSSQIRAPWRYRFNLDNPADRAMASEVLRITAASADTIYRFESCSVRHTRHVARAKEVILRRRNSKDRSRDAQVRVLLNLVKKPERRRVLQNLADTVKYARDIVVKFSRLERIETVDDDGLAIRRANALEREATRLREATADDNNNPTLNLDAVRELLQSADPETSEADARRVLALYDWAGVGAIPKDVVLYHAARELPAFARARAADDARAPFWSATFETKAHRRWHKTTRPAGAQAEPTEEEEPPEIVPVTAQKKPWIPPRDGTLDLRFRLGHAQLSRAAPPRSVARVVAAIRDLDGDTQAALRHAASAQVRLRFDEAAALAAALEINPVKALAWILPLVVTPREARAVRDAVLGRLGDDDALMSYRLLRRELGGALYVATLGPRAGRYRLDLAKWQDRCALRRLLEADSLSRAVAAPDLSQHGDGSLFRNVTLDGNSSAKSGGRRYGGVDAVVDPRCAAALGGDEADGFFRGQHQSVHAIHAFFDCDDLKAEQRDLATDLGSRSNGDLALDFSPPRHHDPVAPAASSLLADHLRRLGWIRDARTFVDLTMAPRANNNNKRDNRQGFLGPREDALAAFAIREKSRAAGAHDDVPAAPRDDSSARLDDRTAAARACDAMRRARSAVGLAVVGGVDAALEDALDLVAAVPAISVSQAIAMLELFPLQPDPEAHWLAPQTTRESRRARLAAALVDKLDFDHEGARLFLGALTPRERGVVLHRVGILRLWSPLLPEGWYLLDLAVCEDRRVAKALVHLEAAEARSRCDGLVALDATGLDDVLNSVVLDPPTTTTGDPPVDDPPPLCQLWRAGLPSSGLYALHFTSSPEPNHHLRTALAHLCSGTRAPHSDHDLAAALTTSFLNNNSY